MRDLGRYFTGLTRRTADARRARIVAVYSQTSYTVALIGVTGAGLVTAKAQVGLPALTVGQIVVVAPISASGVGNGGYYIVSATPQVQADSMSSTTSLTGEVVTRIDSQPTTLTQGGAAVLVTIYGVGLSTAPTYGDPGITDDVAQVITPTLITLHVKASGAVAVGRYSLTAAGITIPNFFVVTP